MIQSAFDNETTRNGLGIPGDDDLPCTRPIRIRGILEACLVVLGLLCDWAVGGETNDIYGRHVAGLKQKAPPGFTVVEQRPFVVVGDEPPEVVRLRATRTVQWAVDALKREYFARDPEETTDIWLFKDKASYERYTRELFQDQPTTPFGYYREFAANSRKDPTGIESLKTVLGEQDLDAFKKKWEAFVLKLRFP
jgi:hypothetical protein